MRQSAIQAEDSVTEQCCEGEQCARLTSDGTGFLPWGQQKETIPATISEWFQRPADRLVGNG